MQDVPPSMMTNTAAESIQFDTESALERYQLPSGLFYLDELVEGIAWDAKYASADNFIGTRVDGYEVNRVVVSRALADALVTARDLAKAEGYSLLVYDAARPQRAVDHFIRWAKEPEDGATRAAHYPNLSKGELFGEYVATRSGHSRGGVVDLTLLDASGEPLDMGGIFDLMDARSHHGAKGLTREQSANRKALRRIMEAAGFKAYSSEWWHYSLKREPFPNQYFDFVLGETRMPELPGDAP